MLIIAQEPSQATDKLRRLLDSLGMKSRVFYTNFETDVDGNTISLASSFSYSSEDDYHGYQNNRPVVQLVTVEAN